MRLRFTRKMLMRQPDQFHGGFETVFIIHHGSDIALFWRPPVGAGLACGQDLLLNLLWQPDIAVTVTMNMHEHGVPDKKGVFMDACVGTFGDAGQGKNPLPQLLMQFFARIHKPM